MIQGLLMSRGVPPAVAVATTPIIEKMERAVAKKAKRKVSNYSKRYGKAFKSIQNEFKKKDGCWKQGGFKRCAAKARKMAKQ
tara:strand:+ start:362 stop:607 length:246 start_codon:yes stop_codon:yes gene_type:complete